MARPEHSWFSPAMHPALFRFLSPALAEVPAWSLAPKLTALAGQPRFRAWGQKLDQPLPAPLPATPVFTVTAVWCAEVRYGLQAGSGDRYSHRIALGRFLSNAGACPRAGI